MWMLPYHALPSYVGVAYLRPSFAAFRSRTLIPSSSTRSPEDLRQGLSVHQVTRSDRNFQIIWKSELVSDNPVAIDAIWIAAVAPVPSES